METCINHKVLSSFLRKAKMPPKPTPLPGIYPGLAPGANRLSPFQGFEVIPNRKTIPVLMAYLDETEPIRKIMKAIKSPLQGRKRLAIEQRFPQGMARDNFYALQFHPEKSGEVGQKILKNFLEL